MWHDRNIEVQTLRSRAKLYSRSTFVCHKAIVSGWSILGTPLHFSLGDTILPTATIKLLLVVLHRLVNERVETTQLYFMDSILTYGLYFATHRKKIITTNNVTLGYLLLSTGNHQKLQLTYNLYKYTAYKTRRQRKS